MMIKESMLRTHARAHLLRTDSELDPRLIDEFLNSAAFNNLTVAFDRGLVKALTSFHDSACIEQPIATPLQTDSARASIHFSLPNARTGETYLQTLTPLTPPPQPVIYLDIRLPSELGLTADLISGTISGIPAATGEFDIPVVFFLADESSACQRTVTVSLLVNQDPKSLWKNLPSDASAPYWKPDEQCSAVTGPDFRIIAASKRGRSHAHVGGFRDDEYVIDHLAGNDWYIAVASDGAGSAKYSRRGSQIICETAAAHLKHVLQKATGQAIAEAAEAFHAARSSAPTDQARIDTTRQLLHSRLFIAVGHAAHHAVTAIHNELAARPELNAAFKDFSSTAMIAACRRFSFGTLCVAYWVGDGAVGVYSKESGITLLGDADGGEFSGQTRFLDNNAVTGDALAARTRFALVDDMTAFILMTDGVSDPKFDTEANLARRSKWDELWQELDRSIGFASKEPGAEQRLLSWLDFWSQGNHDDRTIALILQER